MKMKMKTPRTIAFNGKPAILITAKERKEAYELGLTGFLNYNGNYYLKMADIPSETKAWAISRGIITE